MLLTLLRQLIKHKLDQAVAQNQVQMVSLQCQPSVNHCKTTGSSQAPMPSLCKMEGDSQAILLSIDLVHTRAQMASERQKLKHKVHWSSLSWVKPGQQGTAPVGGDGGKPRILEVRRPKQQFGRRSAGESSSRNASEHKAQGVQADADSQQQLHM